METSEPVPPPVPPSASDAQQWITLTHVSAFAGLLIPCGNIVGPLIVWLLKKEEFPAVDAAGRQVMNFQISWSIYMVVAVASIWVCIGALLAPLVGLSMLVFTIIGAVKASKGEAYTFPLTIKFL